MEGYNFKAKKGENNLDIEFYTLPMPNDMSAEFETASEYNFALSQYEASKRVVSVHKDSEYEFMGLLSKIFDELYYPKWEKTGMISSFALKFSEGISIESLKDRLELQYWCVLSQAMGRSQKCEICNCPPYFILKPLDKGVTEKTWDEIFDTWSDNFFKDKENGQYKKQDFVEYLKENYKPTRK